MLHLRLRRQHDPLLQTDLLASLEPTSPSRLSVSAAFVRPPPTA